MASINLIESFQEFKEAENIDRPTLMKVMEDVFKTLIRKKYGSDDNFDVIVNDQKGDLEIFRRRTIVDDDDLYNTLTEIELKNAILIEPDYTVGEELYEEVDIQKEFGRRAILAGKQTLAARIGDLKKNILIKKYEERVGEIVSGEVHQVWRRCPMARAHPPACARRCAGRSPANPVAATGSACGTRRNRPRSTRGDRVRRDR